MAAILNFKMAAIGPIEKNGTKANFDPWTIMMKKNLGSKNVARFSAKYTTAYTISETFDCCKVCGYSLRIVPAGNCNIL